MYVLLVRIGQSTGPGHLKDSCGRDFAVDVAPCRPACLPPRCVPLYLCHLDKAEISVHKKHVRRESASSFSKLLFLDGIFC